MLRSKDRELGRGGAKDKGSMGSVLHCCEAATGGGGGGWGIGGPEMQDFASTMIWCRRRNWEEMNVAECRSPVQRVMSTQSRAWLSRLRSVMSGWRRMG